MRHVRYLQAYNWHIPPGVEPRYIQRGIHTKAQPPRGPKVHRCHRAHAPANLCTAGTFSRIRSQDNHRCLAGETIYSLLMLRSIQHQQDPPSNTPRIPPGLQNLEEKLGLRTPGIHQSHCLRLRTTTLESPACPAPPTGVPRALGIPSIAWTSTPSPGASQVLLGSLFLPAPLCAIGESGKVGAQHSLERRLLSPRRVYRREEVLLRRRKH